jgi:hypothetical protein
MNFYLTCTLSLFIAAGARPQPETANEPITLVKAFWAPVTTLWGDNGPQTNDIKQNSFGDCWVLSTLAAMCNNAEGRQRIQSIVQTDPNDKNKATVALYHPDTRETHQVSVTKPAMGDQMNDLFGGKGKVAMMNELDAHSWVGSVEKAFISDGYKSGIENGGWPKDALNTLYGVNTAQTRFVSSLKDNELWALIQSASLYPVIVSTGATVPNGLVETHAYTLMGAEGDLLGSNIILRNPWGVISNDAIWSVPNNPGKFKDLGDGKFALSMEVFREAFVLIYHIKDPW